MVESKFDTNRIKNDDNLKSVKDDALKSIKKELDGLRKDSLGNTVTLKDETRDAVLEKHLSSIIKEYKTHPSAPSWMKNYYNFENKWDEAILNSDKKVETRKFRIGVEDAIKTLKGLLTQELNRLLRKTHDNILTMMGAGKPVSQRELAKFDEVVARKYRLNSWENRTAHNIVRDELLARIADREQRRREAERRRQNVEQAQKEERERAQQEPQKRANDILSEIKEAEFRREMFDKANIVFWSNRTDTRGTRHFEIGEWEKITKDSINNLNDEYLPSGQKKADLLKKLEEVIEKGVREVNNSVSHTSPTNDNNTKDSSSETSDNESINDTPASSIFGEEEETNAWLTASSSVGSENKEDNKESTSEAEGGLEWCRKLAIKQITEKLNEEPIIKEGDLEAENRDWLAQIQKEEVKGKVMDILIRVKADIRNKREAKKQSAELDNIIENIPALFEGQSSNNQENIIKTLQTINQSLGEGENETKAEQAKEKMIENNSEIYFDSVIKWAKEEKVKLEEERKKLEEENKSETSSVIEYDEEEQQFLNGEITDKKKKKEIVKRIEKKIHVKKKSWNLWKWLREWYNWLKTKAQLLKKKNKVDLENKIKQIEQELKNMENSSNPLTRQAYQENQQQAEKLLSELNTISQDANQTETTGNNNNKSLLRKEVVIPAVIGGAILLTAVILIITKKRKVVKKKKQR